MRTGLKTCFYVALAGVSVACFAGTGSGESPPPIASPVPLPEVPAVRATYEAEGCAGCHGAQAEGGPGVPALRGSGLDGLAFADAVGLGSPTMPASQTLAPAALEALRRWLIGPVPAPADGPAVVAETVRQANRWARRVPPAGEDADPEAVRLTRRAAEQARRVAGSGVSPPAQGALESLTETVARLMDSSEGSPPAASLVDLLDQQLWPLALDAVLRGGPPGGRLRGKKGDADPHRGGGRRRRVRSRAAVAHHDGGHGPVQPAGGAEEPGRRDGDRLRSGPRHPGDPAGAPGRGRQRQRGGR